MPTLTVNGATVAYSDTGAPKGKPDAPAIVFGHGLLFSKWMFSAQIAALRIAARRPKLLRSLILLDTSAAPEETSAAIQDRVLARLYQYIGIARSGGRCRS